MAGADYEGRAMNDKLTPPAGYDSWLAWTVETMETRGLFLDQCWDEKSHDWPPGTQRGDMQASAQRELEELRALAALGKKHQWREALGCAPPRPGDTMSPEEAVRRVRGG